MLRDHLLEPLRHYFATKPNGLVAAYLFGSVARGQERKDSDVDIGVMLGTLHVTLDDLDRVADMQGELSQLLGRPVDVVALDAASPDFVHRALRDRILLFDGDHDRRIEFEIRARNVYFDLAPHLEQYRRTVLARA